MVIALALGCGDGNEELDQELWAAIADYEEWDQVEPWAGIQPSSDGTHGAYVEMWFNEEAASSFGDDEAADGAIIVKKGYDDAEGAEPREGLTVMWKNSAAELPETGWYWAKFDDEGGASPSGEPGACTGCHESGSDWRRSVTDTPGG